MYRLLTHGDPEQRYGRRAVIYRTVTTNGVSQRVKELGRKVASKEDHGHGITFAITINCVSAGWTEKAFIQLMLETHLAGTNHPRNIQHRRGYAKAVQYLRRVWRTATARNAESPCFFGQDEARMYLLRLRIRAAMQPWKGLKGQSELKTLLAHFKAAMRSGGVRHTLSMREGAELAGMDKNTLKTARIRLETAGWLRRIAEREDVLDAGTWLLTIPSHHSPTSMGRQAGGASVWVNDETAPLDDQLMTALMPLDAFAHRGLGASGAKVLSVLSQASLEGEGAISAKDIQQRAASSKATVARKLKDLIAYGLVEGTCDTYTLTGHGQDVVLDSRAGTAGWEEYWTDLAQLRGVDGTQDRRKARHAAERTQYRQIVAQRAENRRPDLVPDRGDSVPSGWQPGDPIVDPRTGEILNTDDMVVASDDRLYIPSPELSYDELMDLQRQAMASEFWTAETASEAA